MIHKSKHIARKFLLGAVATSILTATMASTASADVVTSLRPLAFIAAGIADGVTETTVLLPDGASPHDYALKPSDLKKIKQADLFIWVGPEMEMFLQKPINTLEQNKRLALAEQPNIKTLLMADAEGHEEGHSDTDGANHDEDHEHHHHGEYNMHIWLSPEIANLAALDIYERLLALYPDQKDKLDVNLRKFKENMAQNDKNIVNILEPAKNKGYFVFHDAYGYFEKHYQLAPLGHFTINPEIQPGAQKLHQIRTQLVEHKAQCVFAEPQFRPAVIESVARNTGVKMGTLDPLGSGLAIGPDSYMQFLTQLSKQYASCLN
ncbi:MULTISPECIES: zinc ABC transporter substrate-binding protein ZnuA [Providencia]|uniref:High-affinity zinc uptake system protein ZnuA n=1 Tax=Providencia heimbachae ATCC 35613 TaxID=1354272 RepID=A0A1B7K2N0_9GAMM|nr:MULTISPECIES: zinc ABC transporter substrate-binding protein ZnuA [Providencia]MBP6121249.1 zinc ABC transporter substrate-binding protein ZnuA [Providencia sp.]NIH22859.1 zinc ABC transporter substrate-binding protein ZnuA [Providencia heimbachae]OAT54403.1 periplasmic substrate-binding component of an ABC superfamily zinc transporter [Providencia heimbachae ATCC 35613]QCJ70255.1 zinc ABC transporter substrate-binding protein ZnuA [Providencia heimbachae]SQH13453.1 High-affinity zinc uptak